MMDMHWSVFHTDVFNNYVGQNGQRRKMNCHSLSKSYYHYSVINMYFPVHWNYSFEQSETKFESEIPNFNAG